MSDKKTLGQIVDDIADQYFALGMDSYSAGKAALLFVLKTLNFFEDFVVKRFKELSSEDPK